MSKRANIFQMLTQELKNESFNFYFFEHLYKTLKELDVDQEEDYQLDKEYKEAKEEFIRNVEVLLGESFRDVYNKVEDLDIIIVFNQLKKSFQEKLNTSKYIEKLLGKQNQ